MSGRRKHSRVTFVNSLGVVRISRDVFVERAADNELIAVSSEPGIPGEQLTLASAASGRQREDAVRVTVSRPVFTNGAVKHELRLKRLDAQTAQRDNPQDQVEAGSK